MPRSLNRNRGNSFNDTGIPVLKALNKISRSAPDLIILDLFLKNDDGLNLIKILKKDPAKKNIPVIVVSSINKTETVKKAMLMGATDYITKPINVQGLKNKCNLILKAKKKKKILNKDK